MSCLAHHHWLTGVVWGQLLLLLLLMCRMVMGLLVVLRLLLLLLLLLGVMPAAAPASVSESCSGPGHYPSLVTHQG